MLSQSAFSQSVKDSLNFDHYRYNADRFKTSFEKRLNTYNLQSSVNYSLKYNKFFLGIDENYFSSLVSSTEKNIKDEQTLSLLGEYMVSPYFSFGLLTQSSIYSNDRKIAINEASNIYSTFFAKINPIDQFKIIPFGGYSINNQVDEEDRGLIYGSNLSLERYSTNNFRINSYLKFQNEDISPRKNSHNIASVQVNNDLDHSLTNSVSANYSDIRKDFYFETDSLTASLYNISKNIQSRNEKKYYLEERIYNSRFTSDLFFDLSAKLSYRDIDRETKFKNLNKISLSSFDTKIEEFRLDFTGTTEYRSEKFFGKLKIDYSEREEKYSAKRIEEANPILFEQRTEQEKKKNNISKYTTISLLSNYFVSSKDNISFSILQRKLVYDTPSDDNFDDRDELLSIMRLSYSRRFNHLFTFFVNLEGSYNHIVYIYAERSSNNNIRRVIKLNSGGEFKNKHLYTRNSFEVSANYTSYDFQDVIPNSRSFSFRQFNAKDSTSIKVIGKIHLDFLGYIKLSEQGDFDWKNFSNNPDRFLAEYYLEPMFKIKSSFIKMGLGIRFFSLQTFGYNENNFKYLSDEYTSIGPITNFSVQLQNLDLFLYGWYEFIQNEDNVKRELANLSLSVNWKL